MNYLRNQPIFLAENRVNWGPDRQDRSRGVSPQARPAAWHGGNAAFSLAGESREASGGADRSGGPAPRK